MLRRLLQEHARHLSFLRFEEIQIVTHRMEALVRLDERHRLRRLRPFLTFQMYWHCIHKHSGGRGGTGRQTQLHPKAINIIKNVEGGHSWHSRIIFLIHFYMMCLDEQCAKFRLSEWQKRRSEIKKQAREGVQETVRWKRFNPQAKLVNEKERDE